MQAQIILQVIGRQAKLYIQAIGGQPMHGKRIDNLDRKSLVCLLWERTVKNFLQLAAGIYNAADGDIALEMSV